jgi:hypothetical protein
MKETGGRRRKRLLDVIKENIVCWELEQEELDCTLWQIGFGRKAWNCREEATELS